MEADTKWWGGDYDWSFGEPGSGPEFFAACFTPTDDEMLAVSSDTADSAAQVAEPQIDEGTEAQPSAVEIGIRRLRCVGARPLHLTMVAIDRLK